MIRTYLALAIAFHFLLPFHASAGPKKTVLVLCENAGGVIKAKKKCRKKETKLSRDTMGVGARGIQGPKGDPGPVGPRGPSGNPWGRVPAGTTIYGAIFEYDWSGANSFNASFTPATAPWIDDENVVLKLNDIVLDLSFRTSRPNYRPFFLQHLVQALPC